MNNQPLQIVLTWRPPRGLEKITVSLPGIEVHATDNRKEMHELIQQADVLCVGELDASLLHSGRRLQWIHAMAGGVEGVLFPEMRASEIPLTCLKGCFDTPGAEHAMAVMLAFSRRLEYDIRQRPQRSFLESEPGELKGKTVGILGLGSIGLEIAAKARCFGMRIIGLARSPRASCEAVDEYLLSHQLPELLSESDFVVVTVPLTTLTRGLIGRAELACMKPDAYLIDVSGRPAIYDLEALETALLQNKIAGANLQIVPSQDSSLWDIENLLISFHRTVSREQYDDCIERFCENLRRFHSGQPLLGIVDKTAGY